MKRKRPVVPPAMRKLARALREEFDAKVDIEVTPGDAVTGNRFRFAVLSPRFRRIHHLKRQDLVWQVADRLLSREEAFKVLMILAYSPNELELRPTRRASTNGKRRVAATR